MTTSDFLAELKSSGIRLWAEGERLRYDAPAGSLTPELREELRTRKAELIEHFEKARQDRAGQSEVIARRESDEHLALSFAQQRLWFLNELTPHATHYNIVRAFRLRGRLDQAALEQALNELVSRHEALRTTFVKAASDATQQIVPSLEIVITREDLGELDEAAAEARARQRASDQYAQPFDLVRGPLLRAHLMALSAEDHVFLMTIHHIVSDGWSMGVLFRELGALYRAYAAQQASPLPEIEIHYADYALWQRAWLQGSTMDRQLGYWRDQLAGLPTLDLPTDRPRPAVQTYGGARVRCALSKQLSDDLRALAQREGATLFMVLQAALTVLLHRYSGQDDIVSGSPIANRNRAEIEGLIGFFVNSLVIRSDLSGDPNFRTLLARVRDTTLAAFDHQDLPFEKLVEELEPERDISRNPLFQVMLAVQSAPLAPLDLGDLTLSLLELETRTTRFDLEIHVWPDQANLDIWFIYNTDLFERATIERMLAHYRQLLESAVADPERPISKLTMMSGAERHQLLATWNETARPYPDNRCLHELVADQARRAPDALAVADRGRRVTYARLEERAGRVAQRLRALGIGPGDLVGVCVERGVDLVVGVLAVLKAGGAYVPLDPDYPKDRLAFMLEDCAAPVVLTQATLRQRLPETTAKIVDLAEDFAEVATLPAPQVTSDDVAYVIYTSGSTGQPKGVEITHRAVMNLVAWHQRAYDISADDRGTLLAAFSFDASVWELWPYLTAGASLHVVDNEARDQPEQIWSWLAAHEITVSFLPTPLAEAALRGPITEKLALKALLTGGDRLHGALPGELPFVLVNHYGPTENTVVSTCATVDLAAGNHAPPIGRPIDNVRAYVLDAVREPVPLGAVGELYLGGSSLARGYLRRPELTEERFVANPVVEDDRLYRTGDLVRYRADGQLEFIGRVDQQIKLRGFRIELGEIEVALSDHPAVRESIVDLRRSETGEAFLAAYVVPESSWSSNDTDGHGEDHVAQWQTLYQDVYDEVPAAQDPTFNISGWNSSYSGEPIPAEEMREWVDATVARIAAFEPHHLLEIGCGSGLLLYRLAPSCTRYLATDFSGAALEQIRAQAAKDARLGHVTCHKAMADDFGGIATGDFDTIVLNSVIQYFPDGDYLARVLEGAVAAAAPGGRVFIGDVRCLPLLEAFHGAVQLHHADDDLPSDELRQLVQQSAERESELLVDPDFFRTLKARLPRVSRVDIKLKRGRHVNELTQFRYDVVLRLDEAPNETLKLDWLDWKAQGLSLAMLRGALTEEVLALRHVPNRRLERELGLMDQLDHDDRIPTVGALRASIAASEDAVDPADLWSLAEEFGYQVDISYSAAARWECLDAVFRRTVGPVSYRSIQWPSDTSFKQQDLSSYFNDPLRSRRLEDLTPDLRAHLKACLPGYMVPAVFILLDQLPFTPSGKVDRRALPAPDGARSSSKTSYVAPASDLEQRIAALWCDVLGLNQVGTRDNFFDLGGHSLLMTQVKVKLRSALGRDVPMVTLFQFPTIEALAQNLEGGEAGEDPLRSIRDRASQRTVIRDEDEAIAIIGIAMRYPGADDIETFWRNIADGVESIRVFSEAELRAAGVDNEALEDPHYVPARGFLEGVELFDAAYFGYSAREAELIDPQQRLFLECASEALERAAYDPARYQGLIGVYGGVAMNTYIANLQSRPDIAASAGGVQILVSNDKDFLATRVSYKLDLRGPAVSVQTACSTSLVAVHHACRSLLDRGCDIALAGGVAVSTPRVRGYLYQQQGIVSPDGHCRTFDADAQGTVGSEGVGIVVLKRLSEAERDGDVIHAVIRGTAINNDGSQKVGFTAPSVQAQAEVIAMAQAAARVEPDSISYVEAHGTATALGDPIEVAALNMAFGSAANGKRTCALGAVKTNIGHADAAAGVAGLIKTVQALKHRKLPPSLHFKTPNPEVAFEAGPFYVNSELRPWVAQPGVPRRAGVSSFGMGGTNAHAVVEEPPAPRPSGASRDAQLLLLSAKTMAALDQATEALAAHLSENPDLVLADMAYTLRVGRSQYDYRRAVVCRDSESALAALSGRGPAAPSTIQAFDKAPSVVFLFPGQGTQYVGMSEQLYRSEAAFREIVDDCCQRLVPLLGHDLRQVLFPEDLKAEAAEDALRGTAKTQCALFVVEYALAQLWIAWGVRPAALIGHSIGEITAACVSGALALDDALKLVVERGRLMEQAPAGAMLAVMRSAEETQSRLGDGLWLASINGPAMTVVSGHPAAVEDFATRLSADGIACRPLHTAGAFHSGLMDGVLGPLEQAARDLPTRPPRIPYVSNVTGTWITDQDLNDPAYWARQVRQTVRFADGIKALLEKLDPCLFLEVGPGGGLSSLVKQQTDGSRAATIACLPGAGQERDDGTAMTQAIGSLWQHGLPLDWSAYDDGQMRRRVELPTYAFQRQRFWIEPGQVRGAGLQTIDKAARIDEWFYAPAWRRSMLPPGKRAESDAQKWLVFCDTRGLGKALTDQLVAAGGTVVTVVAGPGFAERDDDYLVDPRSPEDHQRLLQRLEQRGTLPDKIVHLWGVESGEFFTNGGADVRDLAFYSLLYLAQAVARQWPEAAVTFDVIATGAAQVTGKDLVDPDKALALGLCKVIPQEVPALRFGFIDLDYPTGEKFTPEQATLLAAEIRSEVRSGVVAHRNGYRWVQDFEAIRLRSPAWDDLPLHQGGVYLVTGGLGRVGLQIATHLATELHARLVLVGRSAPPEREQWNQLLRDNEDREVCRRIVSLKAIEASGGEALVIQADVTDRGQMQAAITQAEDTFGALSGVIHSAALTSGSSFGGFGTLDRAVCEAHFAAKLQGARVLEQLLEGRQLEVCLLMSSMASILGGLNFAAYASVNAALDAMAWRPVHSGGLPWRSVNWDGWGIEDLAAVKHSAAARFVMTPDEGTEALRSVLAYTDAPQIIVSTGDLQRRLERWVDHQDTEEGDQAGSKYERPDLGQDFKEPQSALERQLADIWGELLGLQRVGVEDNFMDLGGHSLLATQLITRLQVDLGVGVTLEDIFVRPTIAELANLVERNIENRDRRRLAELAERIKTMPREERRSLLEEARQAKETSAQ